MSTDLNTQPEYLHDFNDVATAGMGNQVLTNDQTLNLGLNKVFNAQNPILDARVTDPALGVNTGPAGLAGRSIDSGMMLSEPQPMSGVSELFGACKNLCGEVAERITPNVQAKLNIPMQVASLDETPKPIEPSYTPSPSMRGM